MPALDAVYRRYRKDGLAMIGVSADRPGNRDDVDKIMRRFNYPAAMLDTAKNNGFGWPSALPVTYIIDREGAIRARMAPNEIVLTEDSLTKALEPLLVKQAVVDKRP
ncbi:MAG: TlpA disulfide reductase family protein, partial [Bdellovibrionales bacterium]